eukprot:TRINITY_DN3640_c0_g1_i2.p1 TRINITY_DN3640_c0_g1~~TRINITY_DN3640_c0_g1_i2.p1  ORF type:complete len:353 (-),score=89.79 TRINITY_DN3640_c0_g1_i2:830-1888(-)
MIRRPPRSTLSSSSAASDVYKRQGVQEARWSNVTKNDEDTQHLLHACDAALGEEYYRVSEQAMFEIKGAIYVLAKHRPFVTNVQQTFEPTGIAGFGYNKGGVMFCFSFYESHLAFVNTHLAAHMAKIKERNQDAAKVLNATLTYSFGRPLIDASHQFDAVWFVGDLNYRIEDISFSACCEQVDESIASQDWSVLTGKDQFLGEQAHNRVLHGFSTFEHDFPPTYKYFRSEDVLKHQYTGPLHKQVAGRLTRVYTEEKNRPPAWCDRILWRTLDHSYCSLETNKRRNLVCTGYGPVEEASPRVCIDDSAAGGVLGPLSSGCSLQSECDAALHRHQARPRQASPHSGACSSPTR